MYTSPKRMILTNEGRVVPAGPGVSGTLIVGEGCQITEERARHFGLLPPASEMPKQIPMVAPIVVRGPEGTVHLGGSRGRLLKVVEPSEIESVANAEDQHQPPDKKPWEATTEISPTESPTSTPTNESGTALDLEEK